MQAAKQVQSSSKEGNCFRRNDQNDVCLSTGTTPSCMEVTFNRFFPSKINDFAHWHENPRQIFAFFPLSPIFPIYPTKCHTAKNIYSDLLYLDFCQIFEEDIIRNEGSMKLAKPWFFQWVNYHFSKNDFQQTFLTPPIKFLFSKSQIFCKKW